VGFSLYPNGKAQQVAGRVRALPGSPLATPLNSSFKALRTQYTYVSTILVCKKVGQERKIIFV